jgi:hypothetical protein
LIRQHRISKFKIHYLGEEAASARPQFVKEGSFYKEEVRAGSATIAQEGLGIASWGSRLASKDITKLFPIQVMSSGGSSSLFWLKMNHVIADVHDWIKARHIC